ncbi:uncharacterized protein HD556DRAFT_1023515 [Suillus plorans]|uniref:Uncharacterized protein n=1 Tax=Suillus plorans TaxID=116603 RepID=A0A9P7DQ56_9AGAM|nr:uncharacterized protein HD556DRAFT_1023515 [Suillus plorans]KAG1800276.1 hypothetical protein HD556DRAFT_1023515 [Suillus plorans]
MHLDCNPLVSMNRVRRLNGCPPADRKDDRSCIHFFKRPGGPRPNILNPVLRKPFELSDRERDAASRSHARYYAAEKYKDVVVEAGGSIYYCRDCRKTEYDSHLYHRQFVQADEWDIRLEQDETQNPGRSAQAVVRCSKIERTSDGVTNLIIASMEPNPNECTRSKIKSTAKVHGIWHSLHIGGEQEGRARTVRERGRKKT